MSKYPLPYLLDGFYTDFVRFHALFLSIIRFAMEKHGGSLERDPSTGAAYLEFPDWAKEACLRELGNLIGPGKALHDHLIFVV